jgi:tetratricopeptide (TPR) repeat protein
VPADDYVVIASAVKANPWIGMEQPHLDFESGKYIAYTVRATGRGDIRVFKITYNTTIPNLRREMNSNPTANAHYELGLAYLNYRFFDEALKEFNAAMRMAPSVSKYRAALEHALAIRMLVKGIDAQGNKVTDIYSHVQEAFENSLDYSHLERDPRLHTREHLLDLYEFQGDEAKSKAQKLRDS